MQYLNENIKNQYKQRLFESILNENIQIDEQSGPLRGIIKGTSGRLGAAGRAAGRVFGQHEYWRPFGLKSYRIIRDHTGDVTHIYVEGHGWITPQQWLDLFLENIQREAKVTLDPDWIQDLRSGRGSGFRRIDRNLAHNPLRRYLDYLPSVMPGLGGIIPDTVDSESDPNPSGGWSYDPTTAPTIA